MVMKKAPIGPKNSYVVVFGFLLTMVVVIVQVATTTLGISYYDEIEIEDMEYDEEKGVYHYPCPCGDRFEIRREQLVNCEDIATCPSCSLIIRVVFDHVCPHLPQRRPD